ncbi:hypothetical protein GCM10028818_27930 [Spirosoma horti]
MVIESACALVEPVLAELLETTRIRYPDPLAAVIGMVALIVPAMAPDRVPMTEGLDEKAPFASDNWAENVFDAANVPLVVKVTVMFPPGQMDMGEIVPVMIVGVWEKVCVLDPTQKSQKNKQE